MKSGSDINDIQLEPFKTLILNSCGFSFESYRGKTLRSGLANRMDATGSSSLHDYLAILQRDHDEMDRLVELLTVNETYFFREPEYLNLLFNRLIPDIMAERSVGRIRITSAGCSTGEEPFSIAMMLYDRYGPDSHERFDVTGVDIDSAVISKALQGIYGKHSFRGVDSRCLDRHFESAGAGLFRIRESVRRMVSFQTVNLFSSVYPESMLNTDIILYRNVSIYFPGHVQEEIFRRLSGCLNTGGYMMVSATETLHHNLGILSLLEMDGLFVYRNMPPAVPADRRLKRRAEIQKEKPLKLKAPGFSLSRRTAVEPGPKDSGSDVKRLFDDALEQVKANNQEKALSVIETIILENSCFTNAHALKASILINLHRLDEARKTCEQALTLDPLCLAASLMLGIIAHLKGENSDGLKRFREAIYLDSSCWPAHFYLAEITHIMGEKKRAAAAYRTALEILDRGTLAEQGTRYFPIVFNARQFQTVCRHKLGILKMI